ncbi:endo alpha-1,4 polygalactosaminidase [Jatrophihabitans fulvus]
MRRLVPLAVVLLALAAGSVPAVARPGWRPPPAAGVFDYQIGGPYAPVRAVRIVDRDRSAKPAPGRYSICYVNAFQTQPDENGFWRAKHPTLLLRVGGKLVQDPGWPGEYILDTSTPAKRAALLRVVGPWIDGCARKGFAAVEPDNLDSWTRRGVRGAITRSDNLWFAYALAHRAHVRGLAIAQKNTVEESSWLRRHGFDFAVAEECEVYRECGRYARYYGARVLEVEYTDNGRTAFRRACSERHGRASIILRDRDVVARGKAAYRYAYC